MEVITDLANAGDHHGRCRRGSHQRQDSVDRTSPLLDKLCHSDEQHARTDDRPFDGRGSPATRRPLNSDANPTHPLPANPLTHTCRGSPQPPLVRSPLVPLLGQTRPDHHGRSYQLPPDDLRRSDEQHYRTRDRPFDGRGSPATRRPLDSVARLTDEARQPHDAPSTQTPIRHTLRQTIHSPTRAEGRLNRLSSARR